MRGAETKNSDEVYLTQDVQFEKFYRKLQMHGREDFSAAIAEAKDAFEAGSLEEGELLDFRRSAAKELFFKTTNPDLENSRLAEIEQAVATGLGNESFKDFELGIQSNLRLANLAIKVQKAPQAERRGIIFSYLKSAQTDFQMQKYGTNKAENDQNFIEEMRDLSNLAQELGATSEAIRATEAIRSISPAEGYYSLSYLSQRLSGQGKENNEVLEYFKQSVLGGSKGGSL